MKPFSLSAIFCLTLGIALPTHATGLYQCDSGDRANWQSVEALEAKMKADGWTVRRVKEDGGCYEAYGTTPEGDRVEAYFDPVTLEKLLVARRGEILFRKED